jgi:hypothetical protein
MRSFIAYSQALKDFAMTPKGHLYHNPDTIGTRTR